MMIGHPLSLSDFIIAAIEEACPEIDGHQVYMRGFARFTRYCEDRHRQANGLPERKKNRPLFPEGRRQLERQARLANAGHGTHRDYQDE